jgi:glutamyl-tRNA synthetase
VVLAGSLDELAEGFDVGSFGSAPTKFDPEDLFPLTRAHVQALPLDAVAERIRALGVPEDKAAQFWRVAKDNITVLDDLAGWWDLFQNGAEPMVDDEDREFVAQALAMLPAQPWTEATWGEWTAAVKEATGRKGKGLFMPLRKALTGQAHGPEMADVMPLLQKVRGL